MSRRRTPSLRLVGKTLDLGSVGAGLGARYRYNELEGEGLSPSQSFAGSAESALSAEPTSDTLMEEIYTHRYTAVSQRNTREILPQRVRRLLRRMLRLLPLVRHPRRRHHRSHRGHCPDHPQKPVLRIPRIPDAPPTHRHTRQRIQRNRQLRTRHLHARNLRTRHLHQRHVQPPRHRRGSAAQNLEDAAAEETRRTPPSRLQGI